MGNEPTLTPQATVLRPTPEMLAAAPYQSLGGFVLALTFLLFLASATVLAVKARARGSWLTLTGLGVLFVYVVVRGMARDAELEDGPWAHAIALLACGGGGLLVALGYARLALSTVRAAGARRALRR